MKKPRKSFELKRETLRRLDQRHLIQVEGAITPGTMTTPIIASAVLSEVVVVSVWLSIKYTTDITPSVNQNPQMPKLADKSLIVSKNYFC